MKSNKDKYRESMAKRHGSTSDSGKSSTGLAIILTVVIMLVILALKVLGNGMAGKDDLTIGIGKPAPDAQKIQDLFR